MHREHTLKSTYLSCEEEGSFLPLAKADQDQIKSMVKIALMDLASVKEWEKDAPKESGQWNALYRLHYDVLHQLVEAFVRFDKIKVKTHECLFAYLCEKYPELELDWNFLEKIRTKRNRNLYYGRPITYQDWKEIKFQINLYITTVKKEIEKKLS